MSERRAPTAGAERLADAVVQSGYPSIVLDRLARQACQLVDADGSCVVVRDRRFPGTTIGVAGCGDDAQVVGDRFTEPGPLDGASPMRSQSRRARVTVPICRGGEVFGALSAQAPVRRRFDERELAVLSDVAELAGAAMLRSEQRTETLPRVRERMLALVEAIDARDGYTADHSETVVDLSRMLGERLGLSPADLLELELGALFHDLGKLGVPDAILNKPAALDSVERALMRRHAEWGAAILGRVHGLEAVATIVRCHHERWDGSGYPNGLAGERIPIASRIVAVCDAYDAMTTDRPYRRALSQECALEELRAGAGTQFDPKLVSLLVASLRTGGDGGAGPTGAKELWLPARPAELARARRFVEEAAEGFGLGEADRFALTFAVNEAVTNAVEHGTPEDGGWVRIGAAVEDGALAFYVQDFGEFLPKAPSADALPDRGRGLAFMAQMADDLELHPDAAGTVVRLSKRPG